MALTCYMENGIVKYTYYKTKPRGIGSKMGKAIGFVVSNTSKSGVPMTNRFMGMMVMMTMSYTILAIDIPPNTPMFTSWT